MKSLVYILYLLALVSCTSSHSVLDGSKDPYLWLEQVEAKKSLDWVKEQNKKTLGKLVGSSRHKKLEGQALKILQSKHKIPYVDQIGKYVYNFWQDEKHVRGIWRRTTLKSYKTQSPRWETVLDVDKLAKKEKESWVFKGYTCLAPENIYCLISLSRGGKDAAEWREFNLSKKEFVKKGFFLPEAKSSVSWLTKDQILVATKFGEDSLTESGYPRQIRLWKRGGHLKGEKPLREASKKEMVVFPHTMFDGVKNVTTLSTWQNFYSATHALFEKGQLFELPIPRSSRMDGVYKDQLLISLKKNWKVTGVKAKKGSLVSLNLEAVRRGQINPGDVQVLMNPPSRGTILDVEVAKSGVLINVLENVKGQIYSVKLNKNKFGKPQRIPIKTSSHITISSVSPSKDNFFLNLNGFLKPDALFYYSAKTGKAQKIKSLPSQFNHKGMVVEQRWATSKDGVKIPYFIVGKKSVLKKGKAPTLLNAYGGFEVSKTPQYKPLVGKLWLEKGGIYVLANIRGGGEFGPQWHQAALKTNRQKAFDDFISVGEHLVKTGVTTKSRLAILGGSNGGLLVGTVMTQRPDLFKAVLCYVPLLDMARYSQLLAGASWMGEYGDPRKKVMRDYLLGYSPYHNISSEKKYPELFLITSTKDDRVHPGHARKFAAKMMSLGHKNLHYFENMEGGHKASADLKQKAKIRAMTYEFLFKSLK